MTLRRPLLALAALALASGPALAHPHVWVTARAEIVFDELGRISAVRNIWQFDPDFSAMAVIGLDVNGDGAVSDSELVPLAQVNVESLAEYEFFTWLDTEGRRATFLPPTEYWLAAYEGRLTLFFTLPLDIPVALGPDTSLEIFDPEYFVAFEFADNPVTLVDAPTGCSPTLNPPGELDDATLAALASIPADQVTPQALMDAASNLASRITVACP